MTLVDASVGGTPEEAMDERTEKAAFRSPEANHDSRRVS